MKIKMNSPLPSEKNKTPEHQKNEIRMKLLVTLDSFQEDIRVVRKEMKIPMEGFSNSSDFRNWYEKKFIEESDKIIYSNSFTEKTKKVNNIKNYPDYLKENWKLKDEIPINRIKNRQEMLCEKYYLPSNFGVDGSGPYGSPLFMYITQNSIKPPSNNWVIQQDAEGRKGTTRWLSMVTFAPLSKKELKEAEKVLASLQKHYFPKGITHSTRSKKQFERDLEIYNELSKRKKKPVKRKQPTGFLVNAKKQVSKKDYEKYYEKKYREKIIFDFDEVIAKDIAKKFKMTPAAVR